MSFSAPPDPPQGAAIARGPIWGELERLLARWRAGDPAALDLLLARIHPMLYRWALANATDVDDADDIAQQALVAVYRKIGQFRSESPLAVWLYRLTTRTAAQRRRTFARRRALDVRAHADVARRVYETDPGGRVDRDRLTTLVRQCYDRLPPQQRAALSLVDLEGYTPAEAAELMELAPVTLRANLFKARASVRRQIFSLSPALAERFARVADPAQQLASSPSDSASARSTA
jgi:RNA polymerase sigma-70 factor, ECF subfamily